MGSNLASRQKKYNATTSHICSFRNGVCFYRRIRRIAGMRTEAPSPDVRIADRPCGLHRRFGYRRFLVSPVRPIAGFVLEALSPEFPSPEPHIAGRSIAGRFLMCYRRVSKSGDEIRRYQATSGGTRAHASAAHDRGPASPIHATHSTKATRATRRRSGVPQARARRARTRGGREKPDKQGRWSAIEHTTTRARRRDHRP